MQRKELKTSDIRTRIETRLAEGASRADVFRELGGTDDVAREVVSVPDCEAKEKYKKANNFLAAVVLYFGILKLLASWARYTDGVPTYFFPLVLFVPGVAIIFAIQIRKYHGGFYFVVACLLAASSLNATRELETVMIDAKAIIVWIIMYLPVAAGAVLGFFLKKRLFPGLGYLGAKVDSSGKYLFLSDH